MVDGARDLEIFKERDRKLGRGTRTEKEETPATDT
jgi:hypothetical protein